ncbi:MAG: hypothetical protein Q8P42_00705 [Gallionella sp.]|nr:hypothetical protein [Gallionella sp.]
MDGDIGEPTGALMAEHQAEQLAAMEEESIQAAYCQDLYAHVGKASEFAYIARSFYSFAA